MLYLLVEEKYRGYPWCQRCLSGILDEVRKKRTDVTTIEHIEDISHIKEPSAVLLLGASEKWVHQQVCAATFSGLHPIVLSNRSSTPKDFSVSSVSMDIHDSMRKAIDYLHGLGCSNLALYGCNQSATSDPWREEIFRSIVGPHARVFYNTESLEQTFLEFWEEHSNYDGIICVNDYAALSLIRHLQQFGVKVPDSLFVIGYGDFFLSRLTNPSITSISNDYEHFGRAALSIYNLLVKENTISTVSISLHSQLHVRQSTMDLPYTACLRGNADLIGPSNPFFGDSEVSEMAKLENLLQQCDATDIEIIRNLLEGRSYSSIAEITFISETTIKYRIRKMETACKLSDRAAFIAFLKQFFSFSQEQ